jgi:hypothetical protein
MKAILGVAVAAGTLDRAVSAGEAVATRRWGLEEHGNRDADHAVIAATAA